MKFTKILAVVLACMMLALCFVACGPQSDVNNGEEINETANNEKENKNTENTDENNEPADSQNEAKDVITMATNAFFKPYEFYEGETIVGIDAEIAAAIAEKLGKTLHIEDMEFSSIITAVNEGSVDFGMAGMTVSEERLQSVDFTSSYASGVQSIIVKEDSPITNVDDLYAEGVTYKVGVQLGTTGDIYSTDDFGAENVVQYSNGNEAVLALLGNSVDCVIIDNEPAKALVAENAGLKILDTAYAEEDYAICVKKGNQELLDALNVAIDELIADGTVDAIVSKYIK